MAKFTFMMLVWFFSSAALGEIVNFGVGQVQGEVVTSRGVQIQYLLGQALADKSGKPVKVGLLGPDSKAFARAASETLREVAVGLEAMNFNVVQILPEEQSSAIKQLQNQLRTNAAWKSLQVSPAGLDKELRRKLLARKFIQFREQNSGVPVTDDELAREYKENHKKYGDLPFAKAKENIKASLSRVQVERMMKDWYDGIENKYHVKNLISEQ